MLSKDQLETAKGLGLLPDRTADLIPYLQALYSPAELTELIVKNEIDAARIVAGKIEFVSELKQLWEEQLDEARKGPNDSPN